MGYFWKITNTCERCFGTSFYLFLFFSSRFLKIFISISLSLCVYIYIYIYIYMYIYNIYIYIYFIFIFFYITFSQRCHGKDILFKTCSRYFKDVIQKTSLLRCFWDFLKTPQKDIFFEMFPRCLSQWRSGWDLSETSHAGWVFFFFEEVNTNISLLFASGKNLFPIVEHFK